jgi:hypothetical protein
MTDEAAFPDLLRKTIRTHPKVIVQDSPGGPIREAEDAAHSLVGRVVEQWPEGVVVVPDVRQGPLLPFPVWVKGPFTYEVVP